jgi:hypothetical protein
MLTARILGHADPAWHAWPLRGQHGALLKIDGGSLRLQKVALSSKIVFQLGLPSPILYSLAEVLNLSSLIPKTSYSIWFGI